MLLYTAAHHPSRDAWTEPSLLVITSVGKSEQFYATGSAVQPRPGPSRVTLDGHPQTWLSSLADIPSATSAQAGTPTLLTQFRQATRHAAAVQLQS